MLSSLYCRMHQNTGPPKKFIPDPNNCM
jgi:hypothetical protein